MNPLFLWVPSQKGLVVDPPQRQTVNTFTCMYATIQIVCYLYLLIFVVKVLF